MSVIHRSIPYHTRTFQALAAFVAIALAACRGPAPTAEGLALLVQPIDTAVSLSAWLAKRPHDTSLFDAPAGARDENLCKTAESPLTVLGAPMTRYALFYIPDPPKGEAFPSDTALFAREACHLRSIWETREIDDSTTAIAFADTLTRAVTARLGVGKPGAQIAGLGTGAWHHATTWTTGDQRLVVAIESPTNYKSSETGEVRRHRGRVIAAAYTPRSGMLPLERADVFGQSNFVRANDELRAARVDSALKLAGIPALAADLRTIVAATRARDRSDTSTTATRTPVLDSIVARFAATTRGAARVLDPAHRAAALLHADIALYAYAKRIPAADRDSNAATFVRLRAAGVDFEGDRLTSDAIYTRSFLWDSYRADSLGAAGRIAFMELLSSGWSTRPNCAEGRDGFNRIIAHGEAALKRDAADPALHVYLGEAYRDVYALAHGGAAEYADDKHYGPTSEAARLSAIEHFKAALGKIDNHAVRAAVWDDAVRLLIRAHTETSFYCIFG